MSSRFEMIRVEPSDIEPGQPLKYAVFTAEGSLLAARGTRIRELEKIAILRQEGWRRIPPVAPALRVIASPPPVHPRIAPPRLSAARPAPLTRTTALVADDIPVARTMLSNILIGEGIERVIAVEDGKKAISRFFAEAPNLVLLDIDMPNLDGLAALKQIKSWSPEVFVCLVSANSTRVNVQAARQHAVDGFLVKPYTALNLKRVLARYLDRFAGASA